MKTLKQYLAERLYGKRHINASLSQLAHKLITLGTREDEKMAHEILQFLDRHSDDIPKAELKSLKQDIIHFGEKWDHYKNDVANDEIGELIEKFADEPLLSDVFEEADFDNGNYDNAQQHSYAPIEFAQKGAADLKQKTNNPRFGDNSLLDVTNEDSLSVNGDTPTLDKLQKILNDAGITDDEIMSGIGGIRQEAKLKVADVLGVDANHVEFLINELSTALSKKDEDKYALFTESYYRLMETEERYGYEADVNGNLTINDAFNGTSAFISGTEAQDVLHKIYMNPSDTQEILGEYQELMETVDPKLWRGRSENDQNAAMSMSKNSSKAVTAPTKPPFEKTRKIKKKTVKPLVEAEDDFHEEIHANGGTYNFPWKTGMEQGTATASFTMKFNKPVFDIVSVRDPEGNEIEGYDYADLLHQAKQYIPNV